MRFLRTRGPRDKKSKPKPELERVIEKRCDKYAKGLGWTSRKMNGLGFRNWCDRLYVPPEQRGRMCGARRVLWVEFKKVGEQPTEAQADHHDEMRRRGQDVHVIDNLDDFKRLIHAAC